MERCGPMASLFLRKFPEPKAAPEPRAHLSERCAFRTERTLQES